MTIQEYEDEISALQDSLENKEITDEEYNKLSMDLDMQMFNLPKNHPFWKSEVYRSD